MPLRQLTQKGAVMLVAFALALGLLELGFRLLTEPPRYHTSGLCFDPELGFRQVAHLDLASRDDVGKFPYRTNSLGFRGPELPLGQEKPAGVTRVVFVGDSFLQPWSVRDEYLMTEVARSRVAEETGRSPEVYNLSSSDFGTAQELLLFQRYGLPLAPDAVVLVLYTGNDVLNNGIELAGAWTACAGDYLRPYLVPDGAGFERRHVFPWLAFFRRHSRAFAVTERALLAFGAAGNVRWLQPWPNENETPETRMERGLAPHVRLEVVRQHRPDDPEYARWESAWRATEALLLAFREECRALGARLLVLVIPMREQVQQGGMTVDLDLRARNSTGKPLNEILDWNLPERRLADFCGREGIDSRFLLDPLRAAAGGSERLYVMDGHLAVRGQAIAGQVAGDWLLAGAAPEPPIRSSGPTPCLPPADQGGSWLDFRSHPHEAHIAWGILEWRRELAGQCEGLGWMTGQNATLLLAPRGGDLVVRGCLPQQASPPPEVHVRIYPKLARRFELDARGPFELRWASPFPPGAPETGDPEYIPVTLFMEPVTHRGGEVGGSPAGILLHEIGFEE